jgi:hypothetical protein
LLGLDQIAQILKQPPPSSLKTIILNVSPQTLVTSEAIDNFYEKRLNKQKPLLLLSFARSLSMSRAYEIFRTL